MTKISTAFNNFSRGKLDHDLMGRYKIPLYLTGADVFKNFNSNFKGVAMYRPGFELVKTFEDCRLIEFRFSQDQNYLCLFTAFEIRFLTYDADGVLGTLQYLGSDVIVATPSSLTPISVFQTSVPSIE